MIKFEQFKEEYYKAFFNKNIIADAYDDMLKMLKEKLDNIDEELEKHKRRYNEVKKQKEKYDEQELKSLKEYANRDSFIKINNLLTGYFKELKEYTLKSIDEQDKTYLTYVNYFVKGDIFNIQEPSDFNNFFCYYFEDILRHVAYLVFNYLSDIDDTKENEHKFRVVMNSHFITTGFDRDFLNYLLEHDKQLAHFKEMWGEELFNFYIDLTRYAVEVQERHEELSKDIKDTGDDESTTALKFEQLTLNIEYDDTATLTDTPLINSLATTKLDIQTAQDFQLLNNYDFNLSSKSIEESEEQLKELNELDRFVLDTIVVDFYYTKQQTIFSDREIATQYTNKYGATKVSPTLQKDINESILKLQNTRIKLDYESVQQFKSKNIQVKRNNPLIWLESLEVKKDTSSNYYKIISTPFFYTYLKQTGSELISYKRELLLMNIKGVDKRTENQNLRHYLIRRIAKLEDLGAPIYINTSDVYQVQEVNALNFPSENKLKKARFNARERAEKILDELKKEYNFTYSQDNEGKRIKGYYIRPKKR